MEMSGSSENKQKGKDTSLFSFFPSRKLLENLTKIRVAVLNIYIQEQNYLLLQESDMHCYQYNLHAEISAKSIYGVT